MKSLKHQTDKSFSIVLNQSPLDPFTTRRQKVFGPMIQETAFVESHAVTQPRIEIEVGDDDFLCPYFIENVRKIPLQQKNSFLVCKNGFVFFNGKLLPWRGREDFVQTTMIVEPGISVKHSVVCSDESSWIYCRHQMNSIQIPEQLMTGTQIHGLNWQGWKENIVAMLCRTTVKTATANGCILDPLRSKSVRIEKGSSRTRRFPNR